MSEPTHVSVVVQHLNFAKKYELAVSIQVIHDLENILVNLFGPQQEITFKSQERYISKSKDAKDILSPMQIETIIIATLYPLYLVNNYEENLTMPSHQIALFSPLHTDLNGRPRLNQKYNINVQTSSSASIWFKNVKCQLSNKCLDTIDIANVQVNHCCGSIYYKPSLMLEYYTIKYASQGKKQVTCPTCNSSVCNLIN